MNWPQGIPHLKDNIVTESSIRKGLGARHRASMMLAFDTLALDEQSSQ